MTLDPDIMVAMHRGEITPREAFAAQASRDSSSPSSSSIPSIPLPDPAAVPALYAAAAADIAAHGPDTLRTLAAQTDALLARETSWTPCQRAARMRSVLAQWQAARGIDRPIDLVIPLGTGSRHDDIELRYLLRSARENLRGLRTIHVIGPRCPGWLKAAPAAPLPVQPSISSLESTSSIPSRSPRWSPVDLDALWPRLSRWIAESADADMRQAEASIPSDPAGSRRAREALLNSSIAAGFNPRPASPPSTAVRLTPVPAVLWHQWKPRSPKNHDIIAKFLHAARHPDVSPAFVACCDDWLFIRPSTPGRDWGAVCRGGVLSTAADRGYWKNAQAATRRILEAAGFPHRFFDTHTPSVQTKAGWLRVDAAIPWATEPAHAVWSLYHNVAGVHGPVIGRDGLSHCGWHAGDGSAAPASIDDIDRAADGRLFMNYNDAGLNEVLLLWLGRRFPTPAPWEAYSDLPEYMAGQPVRVVTHMPYLPDRRLGAAYNSFMRLLPDDPRLWVLFMDHDTLFLQDDWHEQCLRAIERYPRAGLFTCLTNRMQSANCRCEYAPSGDDIGIHRQFAMQWRDAHADVTAKNITGAKNRATGHCLLTSRRAWAAAGGFKDGFHGVDLDYHERIAKAGFEVRRIDSLYIYHGRYTTRCAGQELAVSVFPLARKPSADIAVAVTTHDDPRYMAWCVDAMMTVDAQDLTPIDRFLVIDGDPQPPPYALRWGWTVIRHAGRAPGPGRQIAAETTSAPWIAYVDADNRMAPGLLRHISDLLPAVPPAVGVLYGDMQISGRRTLLRQMPEWDGHDIRAANIVDSGNVWRTDMVRRIGWTTAPHADWQLAVDMDHAGWVGRHHHGPPILYHEHDGSLIQSSQARLMSHGPIIPRLSRTNPPTGRIPAVT